MEMRRVQKVGSSTLSISLPSSWVKSTKLKKGDTVFIIHEPDGSIKLKPYVTVQNEEAVIVHSDIFDNPSLLERVITGNYILGHEMIRVVSSRSIQKSHIEIIQKAAHTLIGVEIIEEEPSEIVLQCILDPLKFPIQTLIKRLYNLVSMMQKEAIQSLRDLDDGLAKRTISRENEVDKVYWLGLRILMSAQKNRDLALKLGIDNALDILGYRAVAQRLERVGDWAENIARYVMDMKRHHFTVSPRDLESLCKLSDFAQEMCRQAVQSLISVDIKEANTVIDKYKNDLEKVEACFINDLCSKNPAAPLSCISFGFKRMAELASEIAEISINRALEKPNQLSEIVART